MSNEETTIQDVLNSIEDGRMLNLSDIERLLNEYEEFQSDIWDDDCYREEQCDILVKDSCRPFLEKIRALNNPELETDFANIIDGIYGLLQNLSSKKYTENIPEDGE